MISRTPVDRTILDKTLRAWILSAMDVDKDDCGDDSPCTAAITALAGPVRERRDDNILPNDVGMGFAAGFDLAFALLCAMSGDPMRIDKSAVKVAFDDARSWLEEARDDRELERRNRATQEKIPGTVRVRTRRRKLRDTDVA